MMTRVWAITVIVTTLPAWLGQILAMLLPAAAARLGLIEPEAEVDGAFYADVRGECVWDSLTLWTLPLAGVLLLTGSPLWVPFGLAGGGMYVYFGGRGILQRIVMRRRGVVIGKAGAVWTNIAALALWGVIGAGTIVTAVHDLCTQGG